MDFDEAREVHDLETMSDIIGRIIDHCTALLQAGRADEIPPAANEIVAHVNVMIYFVLKLLGDFMAATELYENILRIRANFPEVKRNLKLVRLGVMKKLIDRLLDGDSRVKVIRP